MIILRGRRTGAELAAVESGLSHFADVARSSLLSSLALTGDEGRRLVAAMRTTTRACYAAAGSGAVRRMAADRNALPAYERLVQACTPERDRSVAAHETTVRAGLDAEIEAAVACCYDAARPVLMAGAQLVAGCRADSHPAVPTTG